MVSNGIQESFTWGRGTLWWAGEGGQWRPWGLWARKGKKKHVRGQSIVQGKERWLMLISKGSKYTECPPGSKVLPCCERKCMCVWAGVRGTRTAGQWWWQMKGDGSYVCLCFLGNFLSEKKFCKRWMLPKYWFYNLFIYYFYLLLYSVRRLCCPRFPVAVWVRCLISAKRIWEDENDKVFSGQLRLYTVGAQKTGVLARQVPWMCADAVAHLFCPSWMLPC